MDRSPDLSLHNPPSLSDPLLFPPTPTIHREYTQCLLTMCLGGSCDHQYGHDEGSNGHQSHQQCHEARTLAPYHALWLGRVGGLWCVTLVQRVLSPPGNNITGSSGHVLLLPSNKAHQASKMDEVFGCCQSLKYWPQMFSAQQNERGGHKWEMHPGKVNLAVEV